MIVISIVRRCLAKKKVKSPSLYIKTRVVTFCVVTFRMKDGCYTLRQEVVIIRVKEIVTCWVRSCYLLG